MLISKSKFAKICGFSRAAITNATREGGALYVALDGGKIDSTSVAVKDYLERRGIDYGVAFNELSPIQSDPAPPFTLPKDAVYIAEESAPAIKPNGETDPRDLENMTLPQLCDIFGTDENFKHWTEARKKLTEIRKNELANAQKAGELVSRDLIKVGIIEPIDAAHINLLTDGAKTISVRAIAMHEAGKSQQDIEAWISDQMTSFIRPVKGKVELAMKKIEA